MSFRLIVSDLDDSLLNDQSRLSERTLAALTECMRRGARVVLASGRMIPAMRPFFEAARANAPVIAFNGAMTYDMAARRALHRLTVPAADARALAKLAEDIGVHVQAFTEDGYFYDEENRFSAFYASRLHIPGRAIHKKLSEAIDTDLCKLLLVDEPERIAELTPRFNEAFAGRVVCAVSRPHYLECTAPGADKGAALRALAETLRVAREEIAAFGDGQNDITMLEYAALGCAVANAPEGVRARANRVTGTNDEDGVARVLEELLARGEIAGDAPLDGEKSSACGEIAGEGAAL